MLKVVDVIGVANTGAYDGDLSLVTRTKIVRMASPGFGSLEYEPYGALLGGDIRIHNPRRVVTRQRESARMAGLPIPWLLERRTS